MTRANATRALSSTRFAFQCDPLPTPGNCYRDQSLTINGDGESKSAICSFHCHAKPSLRVRLDEVRHGS